MISNIAVDSHQDVGKYCVSNRGLLVFCHFFFLRGGGSMMFVSTLCRQKTIFQEST